MPGVAKNLYSSLGSEINLVYGLLFLSVSFPHIEFRQSFAKPRFAALCLVDALSSSIPSLSLKDWIYRFSSSGFRTQLG